MCAAPGCCRQQPACRALGAATAAVWLLPRPQHHAPLGPAAACSQHCSLSVLCIPADGGPARGVGSGAGSHCDHCWQGRHCAAGAAAHCQVGACCRTMLLACCRSTLVVWLGLRRLCAAGWQQAVAQQQKMLGVGRQGPSLPSHSAIPCRPTLCAARRRLRSAAKCWARWPRRRSSEVSHSWEQSDRRAGEQHLWSQRRRQRQRL